MPLDLTKAPAKDRRFPLDLSAAPKPMLSTFRDEDADIEGGSTIMQILGVDRPTNNRFASPSIQPEFPDVSLTPGAVTEGPVPSIPMEISRGKPLFANEPFDPDKAFAPQIVGSALYHTPDVIPDLISGLMSLPMAAIADPKGTAEAIVTYPFKQLYDVFAADLLGIGSIIRTTFNWEADEYLRRRDESRAKLMNDPFGPIFALQITKGLSSLGRGGIVDLFKKYKQTALENTADLVLTQEAPLLLTDQSKAVPLLPAPKGLAAGELGETFTTKAKSRSRRIPTAPGEGGTPSSIYAAEQPYFTTDPVSLTGEMVRPPQRLIFYSEPPVPASKGALFSARTYESFTSPQKPAGVPKITEIEEAITSKSKIVPVVQQEPTPPNIEMPSANWFQRFIAPMPRTVIEAKATELVQQRAGELQLRRFRMGELVRETNKKFSKDELAEMRYYREGTANPRTGELPKISEEGKKFVDEVVGPRIDKSFAEMEEAGYFKDMTSLDNFLSHFWSLPKRKGARQRAVAKLVTRARTGRKIATYAEGEKLGLKPLNANIMEDLAAYEEFNSRVVLNNELIRGLWDLTDAEGRSMVMPKTKATSHLLDEGWIEVNNRALNRAVYATRKGAKGKPSTVVNYPPTLVHESLSKPIRSVFTDPWSNTAFHYYRQVNAVAKATNLTLSFFHPFALAESALGAMGPKGPFMWGRGLRLLEDPAFLEESIKVGKVDYGGSVDVGRSIVRNSLLKMEAQAKGKPIVSQAATFLRGFKDVWDTALWDKYHRGLKAVGYHQLRAGLLKKYPNVHPRIISEEAGRAVNSQFGGQNWEQMLTNPHVQDALNATFLAPDWGLSVLKQAGMGLESSFTGKLRGKLGGVSPETMRQMALTSKLRGASGRRYWARTAAYGFLGTQMLNYMMSHLHPDMDGHFSWENEPGHGFDIVLPWNDDDGHTQYVRPFKQVREVLRWVTDLPANMGSKSAPAIRWTAEQLSQHDLGSGFPAEWAQEDERGIKPTFLESLPSRAKRTAQYFVPYSFGGYQFAFTLPKSKGMTAYRFRQEYARAFHDDDYGQMERLKWSAAMNGINYGQIITSIVSKAAKANREE